MRSVVDKEGSKGIKNDFLKNNHSYKKTPQILGKNSPFESILEKNSPFKPILERTSPSCLFYKTKIFCLGLFVEILDMYDKLSHRK